MKINIERLIGAAQEAFDNEQAYRLCFVSKKWYQMNEKERAHANWCERNQHGSSNEIMDICAILNISVDKLYTIARLARKWEQKRNWEKCFPVQEHEQKILDYLTTDNKYPQTERECLHWNINRKAEKVA
jgi:HrpA-like RNA helicase